MTVFETPPDYCPQLSWTQVAPHRWESESSAGTARVELLPDGRWRGLFEARGVRSTISCPCLGAVTGLLLGLVELATTGEFTGFTHLLRGGFRV